MMEVAGIALAVAPLLAKCAVVAKQVHTLRVKYKSVPSTIEAIGTECNNISFNLITLQSLYAQQQGITTGPLEEQMWERMLDMVGGCLQTVDTVEEKMDKICGSDHAEDDPRLHLGLGRVEKAKFVWNEDEINQLLHHLRAQQTSLATTLNIMQTHYLNQMYSLLANHGAVLGDFMDRMSRARPRRPPSSQRSEAPGLTRSVVSEADSSISAAAFEFDSELIGSLVYKQAMESTSYAVGHDRSQDHSNSSSRLLEELSTKPVISLAISETDIENLLHVSTIPEMIDEGSSKENSQAEQSSSANDEPGMQQSLQPPMTEHILSSRSEATISPLSDPIPRQINSANSSSNPLSRPQASDTPTSADHVDSMLEQFLNINVSDAEAKPATRSKSKTIRFRDQRGQNSKEDPLRQKIEPPDSASGTGLGPNVPFKNFPNPENVANCEIIGSCSEDIRQLLFCYTKGRPPNDGDYVSTVWNMHTMLIEIGDEYFALCISEHSTLRDYDRLRPVAYPRAHVFVACFSIASPASLDDLRDLWIPEAKRHRRSVPIVLVGCRCEARYDFARQNLACVTVESAQQFAKDIGACAYVECSASAELRCKDVFKEALIAAFDPPKPKRKDRRKTLKRILRLEPAILEETEKTLGSLSQPIDYKWARRALQL